MAARRTADYPPTGVGLLSAGFSKVIEHHVLVLGRPVIVEPGIALVVRHDLDCRI